MRLRREGENCSRAALASASFAVLVTLGSAQGARALEAISLSPVADAAEGGRDDRLEDFELSLGAAPNARRWARQEALRPRRAAVDAIIEASAPCARLPFATRDQSETGFARCDFADAARGFNLQYRNDAASFGGFEAHASAVWSANGVLTPQRLVNRRPGRLGEESLVHLFGTSGTFLDGRVKLSAEQAWSQTWEAPLYNPAWIALRRNSRSGEAFNGKLEVKLADSKALRWAVTASLDDVSDDYFFDRTQALRGVFAMPGRRTAFSSTVRTGDVRFLVGTEHSRTSFGDFANDRLGLDFDGVTLRWNLRRSRVAPLAGGAYSATRSKGRGASLDLDLNLLAPEVMAGLGDLAALAPQNLSLRWREVRVQTPLSNAVLGYRRVTWEADGSWETPLGATDLSYWRTAKIAETAGISPGLDETFQVSHSIRRKGWRLGADLMATRTTASGLRGYSDTTFSIGQTIAYSRPGGPELRLHAGKERARSRLNDDSLVSSESAFNITASLDLTRYLQKRFERDDLYLTVEYRKRVDRTSLTLSDSGDVLDHWIEDYKPGGLTLSYGMKF